MRNAFWAIFQFQSRITNKPEIPYGQKCIGFGQNAFEKYSQYHCKGDLDLSYRRMSAHCTHQPFCVHFMQFVCMQIIANIWKIHSVANCKQIVLVFVRTYAPFECIRKWNDICAINSRAT